ncbi:MAG: DsbA family protein [Oscillospiraceae bacterium]|jgi:predicted DsbA family dithiol-disulfide isomerase|nr:DsbA family protein [Oscillospiraceae bacterium]
MKLEVFFDYACPYCLKGQDNLLELLPDFPETEVLWRPCESHPRPERYGQHSDLCIQGFFFAQENGADILAYHQRMYDLVLRQRVNVENIGNLAAHVDDLLDADAFRTALQAGQYREHLRRANEYAWEQSGVWVVPAYRLAVPAYRVARRLDSVENIGVTKAQLKDFLRWS